MVLFLDIVVPEVWIFLIICVVVFTVFVRVIIIFTILIGVGGLVGLLFGLLQGKCLIGGVTGGIEPIEDLDGVH